MKVLHLVASKGEKGLGAALGAFSLHQALLDSGTTSILLTLEESLSLAERSLTLLSIKHSLYYHLSRVLDRLLVWIHYQRKSNHAFHTGLSGILSIHSLIRKHDPDIVHLHNICDFIPIFSLLSIRKPIVWTVRDMWAFTGGCHYSMHCQRYVSGCGMCPSLGSSLSLDLSSIVLFIKSWLYPKSITYTFISQWLLRSALNSSLLRSRSSYMHYIPNSTDMSYFTDKANPSSSGSVLQPKTILAGAHSISSPYKNFTAFWDAIRCLEVYDYQIIIFGHHVHVPSDLEHIPIRQVGFVRDQAQLASLYQAAHLFVSSSLQEAFGKTSLEAISCGTPVVCFGDTGTADIVLHKWNGYCAKHGSASDLANGIRYILTLSSHDYDAMSARAKEHAHDAFHPAQIASRFNELYHSILKPKMFV